MPPGSRSPRSARGRGVHLVAAIAVACALLLAGCSGGGSDGPPQPGPNVGQALDAAVPSRIADLHLIDSTGHSAPLSSLRGKVVVISDILTLCQETCPMETANLVTAARAAEQAGLGDKVVFLTVTVDPQRDTPHRLAAYRTLYAPRSALPDWRLLTGSPATIAALWKYFGVWYKRVPEDKPAGLDWLTHKPMTYDVEHADHVIFLDPDGHWRFLLTGPAALSDSNDLPNVMSKFLDAEGESNLQHPSKLDWTVTQVLQVVGWLAGRQIVATYSG